MVLFNYMYIELHLFLMATCIIYLVFSKYIVVRSNEY